MDSEPEPGLRVPPGAGPHAEEHGAFRGARMAYGPVMIFALLSAAATIAVTMLVNRGERQHEQIQARRLAQQTTETIGRRLDTYREVLYGVRGLFQIRGVASPEVFDRYVASTRLMERFPGIQVVGFAERVEHADLEGFQHRVRAEFARSGIDYPRFEVHPPRLASEHVVIDRVNPAGPGNSAAIGLDFLFEPARAAALREARDTNEAIATSPVKLIQDPLGDRGFLIMLPAYRPGAPIRTLSERRANFIGVVYAAFRVPALMHAVLGDATRRSDIEIFDVGPGDRDPAALMSRRSVLYDSDGTLRAIRPTSWRPDSRTGAWSSPSQPARAGGYTFSTLAVPGRTWLVAYRSSEPLVAATDRYLPIFVLVGCLLLISLLAGLIITLSRSRARALRLAQVMGERVEIARMKEEFSAVVSHELRTPLTAIRGSLELIRGQWSGTLPAQVRRLVEMAHSNTQRLGRLVNDVLDFERIESGQVSYESAWCDLDSLIEDAVGLTRPEAQERGVEVEAASMPLSLWIDGHRVTQVLVNLLDNAVKFSPAGARVTVEARIDPDRVQIAVSDQGRGIPASHREDIFQPFYQLDASDSRARGGTGLGLSISRSIVRGLGGDIWVSPNVTGGSVFTFTLPRREPTPAEDRHPGDPTHTDATSLTERPSRTT